MSNPRDKPHHIGEEGERRGQVLPKKQLKLELIIDGVVCIILFIIGIILMELGPGFQHSREYWVDDHIVTHTFTEHETVPALAAFFIVVLTILIPLIVECCFKTSCINRTKRVFLYLFCVAVSFSACFFIVESLKIAVARPRPDFYTRCEVEGSEPGTGPLSTKECFTDDTSRKNDANVSFPSAHSAYTMFGGAICSFYIMMLLGLDRKSVKKDYLFSKCVLCLLPFVPAIFTAISRTFDYRHFPSDIITGMVLGLLIGLLGIYLFDLYLGHWNGSSIYVNDRSTGKIYDVLQSTETRSNHKIDEIEC